MSLLTLHGTFDDGASSSSEDNSSTQLFTGAFTLGGFNFRLRLRHDLVRSCSASVWLRRDLSAAFVCLLDDCLKPLSLYRLVGRAGVPQVKGSPILLVQQKRDRPAISF
ncbi:hypothetical protein KCP76_09740 [Salmonella enterica subsp. enterica serovar Weltevreden]|nr:hypothetical protein KCP76_09740 [Salmonella enterica subsp. enterica serovar Weltevreden]